MLTGRFVSILGCLVVFSSALTGASSQERFSAWRALVEQDPAIADDASVDWRQRLILHALTPRQAEEYFAGRASAEELILGDGRTLAAVLSSSTVGRRCIPTGCVARRPHIPDMRPPRALSIGRRATLCVATNS